MLQPSQQRMLAGGTEDKTHAMSQKLDVPVERPITRFRLEESTIRGPSELRTGSRLGIVQGGSFGPIFIQQLT